ncbi:MAG: hypothetical protein WAM85_23730 [Terracidiphilus sp.]
MSEERTQRSKSEEPMSERIVVAITAAYGIALSVGLIGSLIYLMMALTLHVPLNWRLAQPAKMRARLAKRLASNSPTAAT